jgi:NosR/NirI family transcriptional regulator, nitrous oxide reductase regulator
MKRSLLQAWRLGVVLAFGWLISQRTVPVTQEIPDAVLRELFPQAQKRVGEEVFDGAGNVLGKLQLTLPAKQPPKGYRGPAQVAVAISPVNELLGWRLLDSPDTPEHVAKVLQDTAFQRLLVGHAPGKPLPQIDGVSGATLTSLAIAEGLLQKLDVPAGASLKFPEAVSLLETRRLFPAATKLRLVGKDAQVLNATGEVLGWVRTGSPAVDILMGYQGPTDLLIGLNEPQTHLVGVRLRRSYDNAEYVDRVKQDSNFLANFKGRPVSELQRLQLANEAVQGVSGATLTSFAVAEGLKAALQPPTEAPSPMAKFRWGLKDVVLAGMAVLGVMLASTGLRGRPFVRWAWQASVMLIIGFWLGAPLSVHYLAGWAEQGWNLAAPGMIALALVALLAPFSSGKHVYCHQLCPHGHLQLWLGKKSRWSGKFAIPTKLEKWLKCLPGTLLLAAAGSLVLRWGWPLANLEPFDAWLPQIANKASVALAILGLAASLFLPQPYCKYGCPTGALLKWLRLRGPEERWAARDWMVAGLLILLAAGR